MNTTFLTVDPKSIFLKNAKGMSYLQLPEKANSQFKALRSNFQSDHGYGTWNGIQRDRKTERRRKKVCTFKTIFAKKAPKSSKKRGFSPDRFTDSRTETSRRPARPVPTQEILSPWRCDAPPHSNNIGKCLPPPPRDFFGKISGRLT